MYLTIATPAQPCRQQCGSHTHTTAKVSTSVGLNGILQADAYAGYNALYESGRVTEAACMAHARRKSHDVHIRHPTTVTTETLSRIGALYAIESDIKGMQAGRRLAERQLKTLPQLKSLGS